MSTMIMYSWVAFAPESKSKYTEINELHDLITRQEEPSAEDVWAYFSSWGISVSPIVSRENNDLVILIHALNDISKQYQNHDNYDSAYIKGLDDIQLYEENRWWIGAELIRTITKIEELSWEATAKEIEEITASNSEDEIKTKKLLPLLQRAMNAGYDKLVDVLPHIQQHIATESQELAQLLKNGVKQLEPHAKNAALIGIAWLLLTLGSKKKTGSQMSISAQASSDTSSYVETFDTAEQIFPLDSIASATDNSVSHVPEIENVRVIQPSDITPKLAASEVVADTAHQSDSDQLIDNNLESNNEGITTVTIKSWQTPYSQIKKEIYEGHDVDTIISEHYPELNTEESRYNLFLTIVKHFHHNFFFLPNGYPKTQFHAGDTLDLSFDKIVASSQTNTTFWLKEMTLSFWKEYEKKEAHKERMAFVQKYSRAAIDDMRSSWVPASITLAQSMLESDEGKSSLSKGHNNFFGIKCRWRNCAPGHCVKYHDSMENSNDRYKTYPSALASFSDHSRFLKKDNYAALWELESTDYKWRAKWLKKAWYATDPNYANLLIRIIERYDLHNFDNWS